MRWQSLFVSIVLLIIINGCASMDVNPKDVYVQTKVDKEGLTSINSVYLGMTYEEVVSLMGNQVVVGYQRSNDPDGVHEPIVIHNPHRVDILTVDGKQYDVLSYFTHSLNEDGIISDDELTALVFENKVLIGKGQDFLFGLKNKQ